MIADIGWMVLGFIFLVGGAEFLVRGAGSMAIRLGVAPLVVGLTIVAFGTSSPELMVGIKSSLADKSGIALGTVVGSNICNILLILGVSATMAKVPVHRQVIKFDLIVMLVVTGLLVLLLYTIGLPRWVGGLLLVILGWYVWTTLKIEKSAKSKGDHPPEEDEVPPPASNLLLAGFMIVVGIAGLVLGSDWLVRGCVGLARQLHVNEAIISLTLIALGSSLPELATAITASLRKKNDILVGNVVGSNIFNILCILGAASLTRPLSMTGIGSVDLAVMVVASLACLAAMGPKHELNRGAGILFLLGYVAYIAYIAMTAESIA